MPVSNTRINVDVDIEEVVINDPDITKQGPPGAPGPPGPKGDIGLTGPPGAPGPPGATDIDAVMGLQDALETLQQAIDEKQPLGEYAPSDHTHSLGELGGTEGDLASDLQNLHFRIDQAYTTISEISLTPGPQGIQGEPGPPGPKGDTGLTGPPGAPGPQNPLTNPVLNGSIGGSATIPGLLRHRFHNANENGGGDVSTRSRIDLFLATGPIGGNFGVVLGTTLNFACYLDARPGSGGPMEFYSVGSLVANYTNTRWFFAKPISIADDTTLLRQLSAKNITVPAQTIAAGQSITVSTAIPNATGDSAVFAAWVGTAIEGLVLAGFGSSGNANVQITNLTGATISIPTAKTIKVVLMLF